MSSFQKAIDDVLRQQVQPDSPQSAPKKTAFATAIDEIAKLETAQAPGAVPGGGVGEADLMQIAAQQYEDQLVTPIVGPMGTMMTFGVQPREIERGLRMGIDQAAQAIATPGMRGQFLRSVMRPVEMVADLFSDADPAVRQMTAQIVADKVSQAVEPEGSGLSVDDLRTELIAMRGAAQGMQQGQQEGIAADIVRAVGQNLPQAVGTAGALATGNVPVAASIAAMSLMPLTAYSSGFIADIEETDQQRALDAIEGRPLTEYSLAKSRTRAEAQAVIESGVELGGASLGGKVIGRLAGYGVKSKVGQAAMRPFLERGVPLATRALESKAGKAGVDAFMRLSNGTASFRNGFLGRAAGIVAASGVEEGTEELVSSALMAPFTAAPLSEDITEGLYGAFVGGVAGGIGGTGSVLAVTGNRALMNRRDALRPETDAERVLRVKHSEALKAKTNWTADLDSAQAAQVAVALDSLNGMTQEQRGAFLVDLAERRVQTQERAENLLNERQQLDVALMGARATAGAEQSVTAIEDRIKQIDDELQVVATDRLMASATHNAVAEKISEMPALMEQAEPKQVLTDVGTRAGVTLVEASPTKKGKRVQQQVEALGRRVVWFRATDGKFNPAFHSMRSRGVVYLNADANPNSMMAQALEEVFHDIQMFQPQLAAVFMEKAGLSPIYNAGVDYALRGRGETAAIERLDRSAIAQAEDVINQLEGRTSQISGAEARAGAARIEQEGTANAFAAAAQGATTNRVLAPLARFAARRGFLGRETMAAMAVFDVAQRAAAIENVAGVQAADATLSPLARTLLWANNMDVNFARDIEDATKDQQEQTAATIETSKGKEKLPPKQAAAAAVSEAMAARNVKPKATPAELAAAAARKKQVGRMEKMEVLTKLRASLVGAGKMREGERLAMSRRFLSAAASMANLSFRSLTPAEYLAGHKRNKATLTLTQYTIDQISTPQVVDDNGRQARISFEPYGIPGLDVAYMIKKTEYLDEKGQVAERYDEAVGLYSNEGDITDIIAPVMLHAISRYPDVEMRCDCYDVRRPGQTETNGKLPTAYRMFGFVADTNFGPLGFSPWNPEYLSPPPGLSVDDYIDTMVKYWKAEGWVPETDENGNVTNYPGVWFAKLNLSADERRAIRNTGLAGFAADKSRLARVAAGGTGGDVAVAVQLSEDGKPSAVVAGDVARTGTGEPQGNSRRAAPSSSIFVGNSGRISLVNLTLALQSELESIPPEVKGRLLSASQWLYRAVETTPAAKRSETRAAQAAIEQALRSADRAQASYQRASKAVQARRRQLRKILKGKTAERLKQEKRTALAEEYIRLGKDTDMLKDSFVLPYLSQELQAMLASLSQRTDMEARAKQLATTTIPAAQIKAAATPEEALALKREDFAIRQRIAGLRAEINEITQRIDDWRVSHPLVITAMARKQELAEAQQAVVNAKAQTFGDLLADRGILSYRAANDRNYTVGELQGLLDSFSQSIVGWLDEYSERSPMPRDIQTIIVESLAEDLKYAATKAGEESALEWYGRIIDTMWEEAAKKYPEMADVKSDDRRVFAMMLAITSQGEKVKQNALLARALYEEWKANGRKRIRIPKAFDARHVGAMTMNFDKLNALYDHFGSWDAVERMMLEKKTVAEHNKYLRATKIDVNGAEKSLSDVIGIIKDSADDVTYMSSVLGPKIGSFYNNLHKRFDTLTADVWFTRTFFRPLGGLRRPDATAVRSAVRDIATELAKARAVLASETSSEEEKQAAQRSLDLVSPEALINPAVLEDTAREFNKTFPRDPNNRVVVGNALKMREKTPVEAALVRYAKAIDASAAAPDSNYIRSLMRQLVNEAIVSVRNQTGLDYQLADAQAGLWYTEKELYAAFGAADDPAGQDYRKAMSEAMEADMASDDVRREVAEAVAANNAAAEIDEAVRGGTIAENATESFAREQEREREALATKFAIERVWEWSQANNVDLTSFARDPSDEVKQLVTVGGWQFCGPASNPRDTPFMCMHNTDDPLFNPYRNRRALGSLCFTTHQKPIGSFGKYQVGYYVIGQRVLTIDCEQRPWDSVPVWNIPDTELVAVFEDYRTSSTDEVVRQARKLGYDVVQFHNVDDDGGLHDEIVITGRNNLVSPMTGNTLLFDDKHLWKQIGGIPPISALQYVKTLGGSTGARLFADERGGQWVVKAGADQDHQANEVAALRGYQFLNGHVPQFSEEFDMDKNEWRTVTKFLDGAVTIGEFRRDNDETYETSPVATMLQRDFVDHVLMRNWDVIGLEADNVLVDPVSQQLFYVDVGGALDYRAMGAPKQGIGRFTFASELVSMYQRNGNWFSRPDASVVVNRVFDVARQIAELQNPAIFEEDLTADERREADAKYRQIPSSLRQSVEYAMAFMLGRNSFSLNEMETFYREGAFEFAVKRINAILNGVDPDDIDVNPHTSNVNDENLEKWIRGEENAIPPTAWLLPEAQDYRVDPAKWKTAYDAIVRIEVGIGNKDIPLLKQAIQELSSVYLSELTGEGSIARRILRHANHVVLNAQTETFAEDLLGHMSEVERQRVTASIDLARLDKAQKEFVTLALMSENSDAMIAMAATVVNMTRFRPSATQIEWMLEALVNNISQVLENKRPYQQVNMMLATISLLEKNGISTADINAVLTKQRAAYRRRMESRWLEFVLRAARSQQEWLDYSRGISKELLAVLEVLNVNEPDGFAEFYPPLMLMFEDIVSAMNPGMSVDGPWINSDSDVSERMTIAWKKLPPTNAPLIVGAESMARNTDDESQIKGLQAQIADLQRQMRDVQNVTAAQRANAMNEVKMLTRKLTALTLLAEQKSGQASRMKARLERAMEQNTADKASASETVAALNKKLDEAAVRIQKLKADVRDQRSAVRDVLDVVAETEDKVDRVANWAYAIGRNEGLVAGQVAGAQAVQRPYRKRIEILEARVQQAKANLRLAEQRIKQDAKAAQRAIDFAHRIGMHHGQIQGMMIARVPLLRKMEAREASMQRQMTAIRTMLDKSRDAIAVQRAARRIAYEAAQMLPTKLRGPLASRIAKADTIAKASRVAIEATKIAANEEVRQQLRIISALRKRMNKRGMRSDVRQQIETLLENADSALREANRRRIYATVQDVKDRLGRPSGSTVINAVRIYQQVAAAANDVDAALLLYENDHNSYLSAQAARVARYEDLKTRLLQNLAGRPTLAARERADQPPVQSLAKRISLANSDIYTLMVETEGTMQGVINEMLVAAQDGKGEAALEHASILSSLNTAMMAAGYNGIEDYAIRNGLFGSSTAETITVTLGGSPRVLPVGVVMSIAAMDDETLDLFVPPATPGAAQQGLQFAGAETTLTVYPTDAEIRALRAALTPGQRALIDEMKSVLETKIRDRAMEAVFLVEGDQPPVVPNYWPRVRNMDEFQGENKSVLSAHGTLVRSALTSVGFASAREGGRQPLVYRDAFQTWERHVTVALDMIHMAQPYRDASTVLTDPRVVERIDKQHGKGTADAMLAIFSNGVGATARSSSNFIDRLTDNVTGAVLSLSPRTAAKVVVGGQIRLASEIPGAYLVQGLARSHALLAAPRSAWTARVEEVHAYSGYFSRRHQMQMRSIVSGTLSSGDRVKVMTAARGFARSVAAAGQAAAAKQITDSLNAMGDAVDAGNMTLIALVDMLRLMDEQIMLTAVESRVVEVRDEGMTGDAAFREAVKRAERDFRLTQNASDEFDETVFVASNRVKGAAKSWRQFFPFSSDPLKARNQIRRAWVTGQRRIGTTVAIAGNTASSAIIGAASTMTVLYVAKTVASLLGGADEPDDEEDKAFNEATKNIPAAVAAELVGSTFGYVGLAFSSILQSYIYGRAAGQLLMARPLDQARREATSDGAWYENALPALLAIAQLRGVPLYQMYKFVEAQIPEGKPSPAERMQEQKDKLRDRYTPEAIRKRIIDNARRKAAGQIRLP
jgi:hypothetical protein